MNYYAFHRRFPFTTCRTSFPVTRQSEDRFRSQGRFARAQRWLYRHIKTLIALGKLVFEVRGPPAAVPSDAAFAASRREPPRCRLSISGDPAD
jgi:hypothetical protein